MIDDERVGFEPGPHRCDHCKATFQSTPWAMPLMDLRFDARLRFCTNLCLRAYKKAALSGGKDR